MKKFIKAGACGIWVTLGIALVWPAHAWQVSQSEVLNYRVAWGPVNVGKASLAYAPTPQGYQIEVRLKDSSALVDLQSVYLVQGRHTPKAFTSGRYHAKQRENDYRADKVVRFDGKTRQITYTNNLDASDKADPIAWNGQLRDVFSQLYALRLSSLADLLKGQELQVMGTKRTFTLLQQAPQKLAVGKNERPRYRTTLRSKKEDGSLAKDVWVVTLREELDASLTPVLIEAQTKFGTFTATLR
jgi:hypothetical protein